jgi:hypothetical protein
MRMPILRWISGLHGDILSGMIQSDIPELLQQLQQLRGLFS